MELLDVICSRRSIRSYAEEPVPAEKLEKILQAGLLAPTSRNLKPCEFYVVKDREVLKRISQAKAAGAAMIAGCGAAVVVFGDSSRADTWVEDCSIALSYMMLEAQEQGIGNCWVQFHFRKGADGSDAEQNVREILGVPEQFRIAGILSLGIPAEEKAPYTPEDADWKKVHII